MGTVEPSFRVTDVATAVSSTSTVAPAPAVTAPGFVSASLIGAPTCVGVAVPKADRIVNVADGSTTSPVGGVYTRLIVQLWVVPPRTIGLGQVPPAATEYAVLLKTVVNVNCVTAALFRVTVCGALGIPGPGSMNTSGLAAVTVGKVPVPLRATGEPATTTAIPPFLALTVTESVNRPVAVGLNVTFIVQEPLAATAPAQPVVSTEKGAKTPVTVTLPASIGDAPAVRVNAALVELAPTSTVPDAVAVTVWPSAAPLASRRTEAASPDLVGRDLRILNRMVVPPESFLIRFVDHEFARIDEHHHEHAAREHVVGGDLALVVRVPHEREATLVRWI